MDPVNRKFIATVQSPYKKFLTECIRIGYGSGAINETDLVGPKIRDKFPCLLDIMQDGFQ